MQQKQKLPASATARALPNSGIALLFASWLSLMENDAVNASTDE
jgi:hypothetical protein